MEQNNEMRLNLFNDEGKLIPYDDFLIKIQDLYESLSKEVEDRNEDLQFMDFFVSEDASVFDPMTTIEQYQFVDRKIYLSEEIEESTGKFITEKIQFWNSEDEFNKTPKENRKPIQIYISSPGGLLTTTLEIIDTIQNSKTPVYTIVTGTAYSGAFFISIAGHKRFAFKNATFLFHEGSAGTMGDIHKIMQQSAFYKKILLKAVREHVINTTDITSELYEEHKKDDWYFDTATALKLNVIDEICTDVNGGVYNEE